MIRLLPLWELLRCEDCNGGDNLRIYSADLGKGAFIAVLCTTCWHRRQYRAELEQRRSKL
jgi:hypothetical protein